MYDFYFFKQEITMDSLAMNSFSRRIQYVG
jgi:hypothetical protein